MNDNADLVAGTVKATPGMVYSSYYFFADKPIEWWTTVATFVYIISLLIHFYWTKVLRGLVFRGIAWAKAKLRDRKG